MRTGALPMPNRFNSTLHVGKVATISSLTGDCGLRPRIRTRSILKSSATIQDSNRECSKKKIRFGEIVYIEDHGISPLRRPREKS